MPKPERHVLICTNTRPPGLPRGSCGGLGSQTLFDELRLRIGEAGLADRIMVSRTSCLKHCSRGPVIAVQPDNVWYQTVRVEDLPEICESHLQGGEPVERLLMPDIPWE